MAGWDNGSMSYMNNDKTRKASRGPVGEDENFDLYPESSKNHHRI